MMTQRWRDVVIVLCVTLTGAFGCSTVQDVAGDADSATSGAVSSVTDDDGESGGSGQESDFDYSKFEDARERCPVEKGEKPWNVDKEPLRPTDMRAEIRSCETQLENRREDIEEASATTRAQPRFKEAKSYVETLEQRIPEWREEYKQADAQQSADRERSNAYNEFFDRGQRVFVRNIWKELIQPDDPEIDKKSFQIEDMLESALTLDDKKQTCRDKFMVDQEFTTHQEDEALHPDNACDIVVNWRDYFKTYLARNAATDAKQLRGELEEMIEDLADKGLTSDEYRSKLEDPEGQNKALLERYAKYFDKMDEEIDESVTGKVDVSFEDLRPDYEQALETAADTNRWDGSSYHKEPKVRQAIDEHFADKDYRVVDYGVGGKDWQIERSATGNPVARKHNGRVVVKHPKEDYCRIYDFQAKGEYTGSGYTDAKIIGTRSKSRRQLLTPSDSPYRVSACP